MLPLAPWAGCWGLSAVDDGWSAASMTSCMLTLPLGERSVCITLALSNGAAPEAAIPANSRSMMALSSSGRRPHVSAALMASSVGCHACGFKHSR